MQRRYRYRNDMSNRLGVLYQISECGDARLIFQKDRSTFKGHLETADGETISLRGALSKGCELPTTSSGIVTMDIFIVDGETGSSFRVEKVAVKLEGNHIAIESPVVKFNTTERLIGVKANVMIQQYMQPDLANTETELHCGPMKIQLLASHKPEPSMRRESYCSENNQIILEQSDDFLA